MVRLTVAVELFPTPIKWPPVADASNPYTFSTLSQVGRYTKPFAIVGGFHLAQLPA